MEKFFTSIFGEGDGFIVAFYGAIFIVPIATIVALICFGLVFAAPLWLVIDIVLCIIGGIAAIVAAFFAVVFLYGILVVGRG